VVTRCRIPHPDNPQWNYLSEPLHDAIVHAVRNWQSLSRVLDAYGITNRQAYYRWLDIGRGQMTEWGDGTPINDTDYARCRQLLMDVTRARIAREQEQLGRIQEILPNRTMYHELPVC
jgi:hypothetical protein